MAAKKKSKRKPQTKSNKTPKNKMKSHKKKPALKRTTSKTGAAKKKTAKKSAALSAKSGGPKTTGAKIAGGLKKPVRGSSRSAFPREGQGARSASQQSGDLQGLSNVAGPDSESVDELLEEGNAFEADVVSGVESADDAEGREVHTHEVPEDDVPEEYLDEE